MGKRKTDNNTEDDKENSLLANMMQYHIRGIDAVSFPKCSLDLGFQIRTKSWVAAWKSLRETGLIEACAPEGAMSTADHKLTDAGKAHASTPEYEAFVKDKNFVAATNQDHQERIKKRLVNQKTGQRGVQIFDLLVEHGCLQRKELCEILGIKSGTHSFSYALKELKDKGLVEGKGSEKLRLTDQAFLTPEDRPKNEPNKKEIEKLISMTKLAKEERSKKEKNIKRKKGKSNTSEAGEDESSFEKDEDTSSDKAESSQEVKTTNVAALETSPVPDGNTKVEI